MPNVLKIPGVTRRIAACPGSLARPGIWICRSMSTPIGAAGNALEAAADTTPGVERSRSMKVS